MTTNFDSVDYFTDPSLVPEPHPYYDHMCSQCPVKKERNYGVVAVTGWEEATPASANSWPSMPSRSTRW